MPARHYGAEGDVEFSTKKCPWCFTHLALDAVRCDACHKRVGEVDKLGFAKKPVDWAGYFVAAVAIAGFCLFIWWAFFRS